MPREGDELLAVLVRTPRVLTVTVNVNVTLRRYRCGASSHDCPLSRHDREKVVEEQLAALRQQQVG